MEGVSYALSKKGERLTELKEGPQVTFLDFAKRCVFGRSFFLHVASLAWVGTTPPPLSGGEA